MSSLTGHTEMLSPAEISRRLSSELLEQLKGAGPNELDKAMAEAMLRGAGYLRFTDAGVIEHVPYDVIHRTDEQNVGGGK